MATVDPAMLRIGALFRKERERKRLTLRHVEDATGISASGINRIETGMVQKPSFQDIITLAAFYEIPVGILAGAYDDRPRNWLDDARIELNALTQAIINHAQEGDLDFVRLYLKAFLEAQKLRGTYRPETD